MKTQWPTIPLGEIAVDRGGSINPAKFQDEIFELYSIPAYGVKKPDILPGKDIGSTKKRVQPNDVLLSRIVPHIQRVWVVGNKGDMRQIASGEWIIYRSNKFHPPFLRYTLLTKGFHAQFMRTISGVGGSLLRARPDIVAQIEIPLPPLSKQKRIAAILDKADAIRRKRRQAIQLADEFLRSVFLDMFGDPIKNTKEWNQERFDDICESRLGKMLDSKKQTGNHKRKYLRNANLKWDYLDLTDLLEMDFDEKDRKTFSLKYGDLLICEGGEVGRAAIWRNQLPKCYFQKALHRVRLKPEKATPEFLLHLLWFFSRNGGFRDHATSATIAHLTGVKLKEMKIPLPPLELQQRFSNYYFTIKSIKEKFASLINSTQDVFASISQRAFRGEL